MSENSRFQKSGLRTRVGCSYRKGRRVSDPCAILTVRRREVLSARAAYRAARRRGTLRAAVRGGAAVRSAPPAGAPLRRPARGAVRCARGAVRSARRAGRSAHAEGWGGARRGTVRRLKSAENRSILLSHSTNYPLVSHSELFVVTIELFVTIVVTIEWINRTPRSVSIVCTRNKLQVRKL